jgi:hypothetical protein
MLARSMLCLCTLLLTVCFAWAQPLYTVTDLGPITPTNVNADGVVVGSALIAQVQTPVTWFAGQQTVLATLGAGGIAINITDIPEAVGYVLTSPIETQQAVQWSPFGTLTFLPGVSPDLASVATQKNAAGWTAGYGDIPNPGGPFIRAKRWSPQGAVENLAPAGGPHSFGDAIDASNRLWGSADAATETHAALWDARGVLHDLGSLGGLFATIFDVNRNGIGVGFSTTANGASLAVYATAEGGLQPLPVLQGVVELCGHSLERWIGCTAHAINDVPQAVGSCWTTAPSAAAVLEHAVLWQSDGSVVDLNAQIDPHSGWLLQYARGLNNAGQIVGRGFLNGQPRGFLLTPGTAALASAVAGFDEPWWEYMPEHVRARLPAGLLER